MNNPRILAAVWLALFAGCLPQVRAAVDMRVVAAAATPADASVTVDEEFIGPLYWVSANNIRITVGEHRVTVEKEGYFPWDRIVVADRAPIRLEVNLEPIPD